MYFNRLKYLKMSNINKAIDEVFEVLNNYGYQDNAAFKRNFRRQLENISVVTKREIEIDIKKVFDNHKM